MKKLYAFKLERYSRAGMVRGTEHCMDWIVYMHKKTFALMKGKIDNVAVYFSNDRNHVAIFPLSEISAGGQRASFLVADQRIRTTRLCIIRDGIITSVCEKCKHYIGCVANNFHHCEGVPSIEKAGPAVLDFSSLTFVGPGHANVLSSHHYGGILEGVDLSEEAITASKNAYREAGRLAAKSRKYRKLHCSNCIMGCPKVRHESHRAISRDFLRDIYDAYLEILFGSTSIIQELRWCHIVHIGYGAVPQCSRQEAQFLTKVFQDPRQWAGTFSIRPFCTGHFFVQLGQSFYQPHQVILDAASVYKIFGPGTTTAAAAHTDRDKLILANNLFNYSRSRPYVYDSSPLEDYVARYTQRSSTHSLCIPGTQTLINVSQRPRTDSEILSAIKAEATTKLAVRKNMINVVRTSRDFKCTVCDKGVISSSVTVGCSLSIDRRILPVSELMDIVKDCLI